jgi:lipoprotein-releasing system permease protein
VTLIAPQGVVTPAGVVPRLKTFTVVGMFEVGMFEYDSGLALIHLEDAQRCTAWTTASGVRLKLDDLFKAPRSRASWPHARRRCLHQRLDAQPRQLLPRRADREEHDVHHPLADRRRRRLQHRVDAGHGGDRQAGRHRHPAHAGRQPGSIMAVFIVQGALIGFIGLGLGVAGGVALALNVDVVVPFIERLLGTQFLSKEVYYISDLPSDLQWGDVTTITACLRAALVATLYPSWRARGSIRRRRCAMSENVVLACQG